MPFSLVKSLIYVQNINILTTIMPQWLCTNFIMRPICRKCTFHFTPLIKTSAAAREELQSLSVPEMKDFRLHTGKQNNANCSKCLPFITFPDNSSAGDVFSKISAFHD